LGKFWRAQEWKMLIYYLALWNILQTFEIFYDHLVHFVFIWYIFSGLLRTIWQPCTNAYSFRSVRKTLRAETLLLYC
jgi:uncharacterized protein HemY